MDPVADVQITKIDPNHACMCFVHVPSCYAICGHPPKHAWHAAWLARFGSGLFMVVQMIILLDMAQTWNDDWVAKEDER